MTPKEVDQNQYGIKKLRKKKQKGGLDVESLARNVALLRQG
jgi:hypothetical protein